MFDYSELFREEQFHENNSWFNYFNSNLPFSQNLNNLLKRAIFLPHDHYDIITAYALLPSALCRVVPYLFLCGISGSGKSTIGKLIASLYNISINSSSDTFAAIRNILNSRKYGQIELPCDRSYTGTIWKDIELNTCLVWDDLDPKIFFDQPNLFRLFKCGYDRSSDIILIAGETPGTVQEFRCFCPKILSSITPIHQVSGLEELARRFLLIPTKTFELLPEFRKQELGITQDNFYEQLLPIDTLSFSGITKEFKMLWNTDRAKLFLTLRRDCYKYLRKLNSLQKQISFDLLACGVASDLWQDLEHGQFVIQEYWKWREDYEKNNDTPLKVVIEDYIKNQFNIISSVQLELSISHSALRTYLDIAYIHGQLIDKPKQSEIKKIMIELGFIFDKGKWNKNVS